MATLLEKALAVTSLNRRKHRDNLSEELDLVCAYAEGKITHAQLCAAVGLKTGSVGQFVASVMSAAYRQGLLVRKGATGDKNNDI